MKWFILIIGIISNASASILIKLATTAPYKISNITNPISLMKNWPLCLGIIMYVMAFMLYILALARLPLNITHPILTGGAIATVSILSVLIFKESYNWTTILGILLIILGIAFLTFKT